MHRENLFINPSRPNAPTPLDYTITIAFVTITGLIHGRYEHYTNCRDDVRKTHA